jgi:iron complex outermembrane receptor protein
LTEQTEAVEVPAEPPISTAGDVVVTGSRIRVKSAFTASAPVQVMNRKQIEQTGATTLADVVQHLTVAQGSGFDGSGTGSRQGRIGVTGVDLRGLGFGATLVLVNGRRLPLSGGTALAVAVRRPTWAKSHWRLSTGSRFSKAAPLRSTPRTPSQA